MSAKDLTEYLPTKRAQVFSEYCCMHCWHRQADFQRGCSSPTASNWLATAEWPGHTVYDRIRNTTGIWLCIRFTNCMCSIGMESSLYIIGKTLSAITMCNVYKSSGIISNFLDSNRLWSVTITNTIGWLNRNEPQVRKWYTILIGLIEKGAEMAKVFGAPFQ